MNGVDITLEQCNFLVVEFVYEISDGLINFLTNPDIQLEDIEDGDGEKIGEFFRGILDMI